MLLEIFMTAVTNERAGVVHYISHLYPPLVMRGHAIDNLSPLFFSLFLNDLKPFLLYPNDLLIYLKPGKKKRSELVFFLLQYCTM